VKYIVYSLNDIENNIIYIGYTSRSLKKRLIEHRSRKKLVEFITINKICEKETLQKAIETESSLINLIGKKRLLNRFAQNTSAKRRLISERSKNRQNHPLKNTKKTKELVEKTLIGKKMKPFRVYKESKLVGVYINKTEAAKAVGISPPHFINGFNKKYFKTRKVLVEII
jgi:hypothetical protein